MRTTTERLYPVLPTATETLPLDADTVEIESIVPEEPAPKRLFLGRYAGRLSSEPATNQARNVGTQIEVYLSWIHDAIVDGRVDPLMFWQSDKARDKLPNLVKMAARVLSVPASSAPIERVFSHGSIIMRPHRASMADETLTQLIILKCNRLKLE